MDSPEAYRRYAAVQLITAIQQLHRAGPHAVPLDIVLPAVDAMMNAALAQTRARWADEMAILPKHPKETLFEFLQPDPLPQLDPH